MIREAISETHFGTSTAGSLASTALNRVGPDPNLERYSDMPHDAVEIAKKIRELIGGDAGFPVGDWGDEAFNSAAEACADALINQTQQGERIRTSTRIKILDSMDMSLDLLYGTLSGHEGPISGIAGKQKYLGRTLSSLRGIPSPRGADSGEN